jgi:hypothetical protein
MSETVRREDFTNNLFTFLVETFESPPRPSSAYLDQKTGLFDTLTHISAEEASRPITEGGTTIAAQVEHTRFYLDVLEQFMDGRTEKVNWQDSWQVKEVTPETWETLKEELRASYERISRRLKGIETWGNDEVGDGMAIVIHTAYHLGAIRQIMRALT